MRNKVGTLGNTDEHSAFAHREWHTTIICAAAGCSCTYVRHISHSQLMCLPSMWLGLWTTSLVRRGRRAGPPSSPRPVLSSGRWPKLLLIAGTAVGDSPLSLSLLYSASSNLPERPLHLSLGKVAQTENHSINSSITVDDDVLLCIYLRSIYRGCCPIFVLCC